MIASMRNMRALHGPGVVAWSPITGEEYSADPGDYWWADDGWTQLDAEGEPMILVRRRSEMAEVTA